MVLVLKKTQKLHQRDLKMKNKEVIEKQQTEEEAVVSKREEVLLARKKRLQRQKIGNRPVPANLK